MSTTVIFSQFKKYLPCGQKFLGRVLLASSLLGGLAASSLLAAPDRVGEDAPHQERNSPANDAKFRVTGPQVPVVSVAQSSEEGSTDIKIRKSTVGAASAKTSTARKSNRTSAKAAATAQAKPGAKQVKAAEPVKPLPASYFDNQRIGEDAPHQERNSDVNARGARLLIWERE